jgi:hypothetical protein
MMVSVMIPSKQLVYKYHNINKLNAYSIPAGDTTPALTDTSLRYQTPFTTNTKAISL